MTPPITPPVIIALVHPTLMDSLVTDFDAEAEVSGIVISLFSITVVECVVAAIVLEVLGKTLEGHESALSSSKN